MSKLLKVLLLAACAGACFAVFSLYVVIAFSKLPANFYTWTTLYEWSGMWLIGFFMCLIFGTPFLLIIDKYFSRFKTRYITGGFVAGWVAWLFTNGPLFEPNVWFVGYRWVLDGINYVGIYVWLGFCTGLLFTALLWTFHRSKRKKS